MQHNNLRPPSEGEGTGFSFPLQTVAAWIFSEMGDAMAPAILEQEKTEQLTEEQKKAILKAYDESLHDNGVDALTALEEIRAAHGF